MKLATRRAVSVAAALVGITVAGGVTAQSASAWPFDPNVTVTGSAKCTAGPYVLPYNADAVRYKVRATGEDRTGYGNGRYSIGLKNPYATNVPLADVWIHCAMDNGPGGAWRYVGTRGIYRPAYFNTITYDLKV